MLMLLAVLLLVVWLERTLGVVLVLVFVAADYVMGVPWGTVG